MKKSKLSKVLADNDLVKGLLNEIGGTKGNELYACYLESKVRSFSKETRLKECITLMGLSAFEKMTFGDLFNLVNFEEAQKPKVQRLVQPQKVDHRSSFVNLEGDLLNKMKVGQRYSVASMKRILNGPCTSAVKARLDSLADKGELLKVRKKKRFFFQKNNIKSLDAPKEKVVESPKVPVPAPQVLTKSKSETHSNHWDRVLTNKSMERIISGVFTKRKGAYRTDFFEEAGLVYTPKSASWPEGYTKFYNKLGSMLRSKVKKGLLHCDSSKKCYYTLPSNTHQVSDLKRISDIHNALLACLKDEEPLPIFKISGILRKKRKVVQHHLLELQKEGKIDRVFDTVAKNYCYFRISK